MKRFNPNRQADWERALEERLRTLPDLPAPPTLSARVMARVRAMEATPWWHRAWWAWPRPVQGVSIVLGSAALVLLSMLFVEVREALAASYLHGVWQEWLAQMEPVLGGLATLATAAELVMQRLCGVVCGVMLGMCIVLYLSCVGLGTVLYRLVLPGRVFIGRGS